MADILFQGSLVGYTATQGMCDALVVKVRGGWEGSYYRSAEHNPWVQDADGTRYRSCTRPLVSVGVFKSRLQAARAGIAACKADVKTR